jgi:hypothetical protein
MATNYGFSGLKNNQSNPSRDILSSQIAATLGQVLGVRVKDIILDDTHPKFQKYGEWNGIGTIEYELTDTPNKTITINAATPLLPHLKNYPLVNEIVLIFALPNRNQSERLDQPTDYYYLNSINVWNHPHHNAIPNPYSLQDNNTSNSNVDYQEIEKGVPKKVESDNQIEIPLNPPSGGNFVEKSNIHPILPFMGDNIFEGRFGNSIRLGNTSKVKSLYNNNWSNIGKNGDPITILRNGQPENASETGFEPIVENINNDLSSIYLTSTQQIPLSTDFPDFPALNKNPESLSEYSKNQIILSSGRLVFNSKGDSIFLSSNKSISLNSSEDIALFSRNSNITLQGKEVKLGEKRASESIILGDKFMEGFEQLLFGISLLCDSLTIEPKLGPSSATAANLKQMANNMKSQLNQYLSKTVKSI